MSIRATRLSAFSVLALLAAGCADEPIDQTDLPLAAPVDAPSDEPTVRVRDEAELARMQAWLDDMQRPEDIVTTGTLPGGEEVNCVAIDRQPSVRDRGVPVLTHPAELPEGFVPTQAKEGEELVPVPEEGTVCPDGTVAILPLTIEQLSRFETLEDFHAKFPSHLTPERITPGEALGGEADNADLEAPRVGSTASHQYAHAYRVLDNYGMDAYFNLWAPAVEISSEFSLSQMWVYRGSGASLETVETGWQSYRDLYGDNYAHLFTYFTPDNYGAGGCYNASCTGWVQTSTTVTPGMTLTPTSTSGGTQYTIRLSWYRDSSGNWWLYYQTGWVGYYPRSLFDTNGLYNKASTVDIGGEIVDANSVRHTTTDMGSGAFPSSGYTYTAYDRNIQYISTAAAYTALSGLTAARTDSYCYEVTTGYSSTSRHNYHNFGGSGYNTNCT